MKNCVFMFTRSYFISENESRNDSVKEFFLRDIEELTFLKISNLILILLCLDICGVDRKREGNAYFFFRIFAYFTEANICKTFMLRHF